MACFHHCIKSGKKGTAADHAAYIGRKGRHSKREDLVFTEHGNMPKWAENDPSQFWKAADLHERVNGAVYREHEVMLPDELTRDQQKELVRKLVAVLAGDKPYEVAVHAPSSALEGVPNTHMHLMLSDRMDDGIERSPEQTFMRHNTKHPEQGGCKKGSGGKNPLALRDEVIETRKKCAEFQNAVLAKYGHTARVDHRTLRQRGINRAPEQYLGPARIRNMTAEEKARFFETRKSCA